MTKTRLLFVNYHENSLIKELEKRDYCVFKANSRDAEGCSSMFLDIEGIKDKVDLIYFAKFYPPSWDDLNLLLHKQKIPIIYGFHAPLFIWRARRPTNYFFNVVSLMKLFLMKLRDPIYAVHLLNTYEYTLLKFSGFKCFYSPLGVNTKQFSPSVKGNIFTIVFSGPRYVKGVDMLGKIVPRILRHAKDVKIILTDEGYKYSLNSYFYSLKQAFEDQVEVYSGLSQDKFARLLSSAHLLLFPSRYESFGRVVLEALSSGMPVVAFDIQGAVKDILKNGVTGTIVKPFDVEGITRGILDYYERWKNRTQEFEIISYNCRNHAMEFDWSIVSDRFNKIFQEVLENKTT